MARVKARWIFRLAALYFFVQVNYSIGNAAPKTVIKIDIRTEVRAAAQIKSIFQSALRAAEQGNASEQYYAGKFYRNGTGVKKDYIQAYKWLHLSAPTAGALQENAVNVRREIGEQMTPDQKAQALKLAREWKTEHPGIPVRSAIGRMVSGSEHYVPPYRVGGDISPPVPINNPLPLYTAAAFDLHVEGMVLLQCTVRKDGTVDGLKVFQHLGHGLDESAIRAVAKWRFKPSTRKRNPVDVLVYIAVLFVIGL
jgi:TonB family protein